MRNASRISIERLGVQVIGSDPNFVPEFPFLRQALPSCRLYLARWSPFDGH